MLTYLHSLDALQKKVNYLEQMSMRNNIIINDVTETYAERTTAAADNNDPFDQPPLPREDTIETACAIFRDSCNVTVISSDIVLHIF